MKASKNTKLIALICCLALALTFVAGCNNAEAPAAEEPAAQPEAAEPAAPAAEPAAPEAEPEATVAWPERSVNVIITHGAGGDTDFNARLISKYLEEALGVPFVCNNVTGSNGSIAMAQGKDADADGYTLVMTNTGALTGNEASGMSDFGYEAFSPAAIYGKQSPLCFVARANTYKDLSDVVAKSKEAPETIRCGFATGGIIYAASMFLKQEGAEFAYIETGDAAERLTALLGGQVDVTYIPYLNIKDYVEAGELAILSTVTPERADAIPDVPTGPEQGFESFQVPMYYLVLAPAGTDAAIVEKLNQTINDIVYNNADYAGEILQNNGTKPYALSVDDTVTELKREHDLFMGYVDILKIN